VVCFSQAQEHAVEGEIERRASKERDLADLLTQDRLSGFFVKNLENVQGDDRDIIIETILNEGSGEASPITIRTHRYGDMSWIAARQIDAYAREYGWRERFEPMMIRIAADILEDFDPARERIWIAERNGERVGSVCVVAESKTVARLRLLLVEPDARGSGLGRRLVGQCIDFARAVGYRKMILWTQDVLYTARGIYEREGFKLVAKKKHRDFGVPLIGETWELSL
jgi:GNAT superfamily N-acetyltransferase